MGTAVAVVTYPKYKTYSLCWLSFFTSDRCKKRSCGWWFVYMPYSSGEDRGAEAGGGGGGGGALRS